MLVPVALMQVLRVQELLELVVPQELVPELQELVLVQELLLAVQVH